MCGIGVMLGSPERAILNSLNEFQSHRGPDGSNIWFDEFCGFAHTRLAIVDVIGSNQPIQSDSGTVLVHNGEIYNYIALRKELLGAGYVFRTQSDTEVILNGYIHWGSEVFKKLEGMFSIAIVNLL